MSFIEDVIETVNSKHSNMKRDGHHGTTDSKDTIKSVVKDLWDRNVFEFQPGRSGHPSFPNFKCQHVGWIWLQRLLCMGKDTF